MTDITIPPAALEAGAISLHFGGWGEADEAEKAAYRETARAAFLAMIGNWPGMSLHQQDINTRYSYFVLPITEKTDDKA